MEDEEYSPMEKLSRRVTKLETLVAGLRKENDQLKRDMDEIDQKASEASNIATRAEFHHIRY